MTRPATLRRLGRDRRGVSLIEFGLALPLVAGFMLGGIELSNYILAANTTQRLATSMADMLSQVGVGGVDTTEAQIYDMFYALDVAAKPLDMRKNGRVIFTVIRGVTQSSGTVRNEFADATYAQQFSGGYTGAVPIVGCARSTTYPTFPRALPPNELMVHVQVTYEYQPIFAPSSISYFTGPPEITRTASYRIRKNRWNITNDSSHPARSNCTTRDGL